MNKLFIIFTLSIAYAQSAEIPTQVVHGIEKIKKYDLQDVENYAKIYTSVSSWTSSPRDKYIGHVTIQTCWHIAREIQVSPESIELTANLIYQALPHITLEEKVVLLTKFRYSPNDVKYRKEHVEALSKTLQEFFDTLNQIPDEIPLMNVIPPLETGLPAGVSPENIQDLQLRAEYEANIKENSKVAKQRLQRTFLRNHQAVLIRKVAAAIVENYSQGEDAETELTEILTKNIKSEKIKNQILEQVKNVRADKSRKKDQ
ncbi:hypothetical protein PQO03_10025 [Lentisphaera profundi]|uniref:Uncharacterized protein n=1 Tax=Lentisphaera profundi TaxID=1658616 RepID=A0ABY7VPH5_9BACT|nr:hypothetical protein [Lentisphaera profundi]WDE96050.1 hypothetical protein PQO03_10025 [Lentisphaera profundi]